MSIRLEEMPLFPLSTVLLPYQTLPLHIFEERYLNMVQGCIEEDKSFGVLLIREGDEVGGEPEPYLVGTSARIASHRELADGKRDIITVGERRFRVRQFDRTRAYLTGYVEPIVELEWTESPVNRALVSKAKEAFEYHLRSLFLHQEVDFSVQFPDDPVVLSFAIAAFVNLPLIDKQRLLEMTDTASRLGELIPILESHFFANAMIGKASPTEEFADVISRN